jgi:RND family efflux transporter MFP subunit
LASDNETTTSARSAALGTLQIDRRAGAPLRRTRPLYRRAWVWVLVLVVLAGAAGAVRVALAPPLVELATVATAYPSQALALLNATGRVTASTRASVSSKATGRLEWLGVVEGQKVEKGDIIARLESRDVAAQREQSAAGVLAAEANMTQGQAELTNAEADLRRAKELAEQRFLSTSAVEQAQARVNKTRAGVDALRAQIAVSQANLRAAGVNVEQTLIRAPFTGIVLTKSANIGDIVTPFSSAVGTIGAVVTMADMSTLEVEADVSESSISKVRVGQPIEILLDAYPELRLAGSVSRIVPTVDRSKATLLVKIRFDETDARVLPDMSAKVAFLSRPLLPEDRKPVPAVRPEAIARRVVDGAPRDVVFVATEPAPGAPAGPLVVRQVPVQTAGKVGDLLRVDGLAPGARVVLNPTDKLADGRPVTTARK